MTETFEYTSAWTESLKAEGEARGEAKGEAKTRSEDTLRILRKRGITVPDSARERITDCQDLELLETWFERSLDVDHINQLFQD